MRSHPLLATLLAAVSFGIPSTALAFEDMDCIGTEFCTGDDCAPSATVFTAEFDWSAEAMTLTFDGQPPLRLELVPSTQAPSAADGTLAFAQPDGDVAMILEVRADRIEAGVSTSGGLHLGQCTAREAA